MAFGGGPSVPATPPPPPLLQQPNVSAAGRKAAQDAAGSGGQGSTVKTGPEGAPGPADTQQKTLLG